MNGRPPFRHRAPGWVALALLLGAACSSPTESEDAPSLALLRGNDQFGTPGSELADPFEVIVTSRTGRALASVAVTWRVTDGAGASVVPLGATTGTDGVARAMLVLGPDVGTYRVEATIDRAADRVTFEARAVHMPVITGVEPAQVSAGGQAVVTGSHFSAVASENIVLFGGMTATVQSASASQLSVVVPPCLPPRAAVPVTAQLGAVTSAPMQVGVGDAGGGAPIQLARGEVLRLSSAAALECVRLPATPNAEFLVVPHNAAEAAGAETHIRVRGLQVGAAPAVAVTPPEPGPTGFSPEALEYAIRMREREIRLEDLAPASPPPAVLELASTPPAIGSRRDFWVVDADGEFTRVTAELKLASQHALLYQDIRAPAGGFTAQDFQNLGSLFDDPIYETVIGAFGAASDIDGNGRVIVLFTPAVNALTPRASDSFFLGFFYGHDLTTRPNSNQAEILYTLVPDPAGQFSGSRSRQDILDLVPPVLAHELQHLVHYNQRWFLRNVGLDSLWISEGLAHISEDLVGAVFRDRGDEARAWQFEIANAQRAHRFLPLPARTSLIETRPPGSIQERGGQWLFFTYLAAQFGPDVLRRMTQTDRSGVANVAAEAGRPWGVLVADWGVALWADGAPALDGVALDARHTFPGMNLRVHLSRWRPFPLTAPTVSYGDFVREDRFAAAGPGHFLLRAGAAPAGPQHLHIAGRWGGPFAPDSDAGVSILRVR